MPRRGLLAGLMGGLFAALPSRLTIDTAEARAKKKGKRKKKHHGHKKNGQNERQNSTPETPPAPLPPSGPITSADATCTGPLDFGLSISNMNGRSARTFTAGASGPLVRADVPISKNGGTPGNYILGLSPVAGPGVPDNTYLAAATVLDPDVSDGSSTVSFAFATPANVVAGTQYALILTRPDSNQLVWQGHIGKTCVGAIYSSPSQTGPFSETLGDFDLHLTTFVTS